MTLEDLKLLIDVAWHERHGQQGFTVGQGFNAAADRLVRAGFLIRNPSQMRRHAQVTVTTVGTKRVEWALFVLRDESPPEAPKVR